MELPFWFWIVCGLALAYQVYDTVMNMRADHKKAHSIEPYWTQK